MLVSQLRHHTATRRALDEALHDEEGLVNLLHSTCILSNGSSDGRDTHRTATELVDDGQQDLIVDLIETVLVDVQGCQRYLRDLRVDLTVAFYLGEVANSTQQGVGDTGRTTTTACNLEGSIFRDGHSEDTSRTLDDGLQRLWVVILQVHIDAETGSQGSRQQTATGSGTHQRKRVQVYLDATG